MYKIFFVLILLLGSKCSLAQRGEEIINRSINSGNRSNNTSNTGNNNSSKDNGARKDSIGFEHRVDDTITISYRYLDSIRSKPLDSSINDFYKYFSEPATQQYLGNTGAAGYSLIFTPFAKAGWDPGFHAFDAYRYTLENTKLFKTTKPFTQINYELASGKEQVIKILHTQNPRPNLNVGFEYNLITAPGIFVTQNTNHNNYRLFSTYQGKRKRYAAFFILLGNSIKGSENGGIKSDSFLSNPLYNKRFTVPVNLGGPQLYSPNPFKSSVTTGNIYKDLSLFIRQTYDLGKKDSIAINDSTTEYLFYSKLRFQHTFTYNTYNYQFRDFAADSTIYKNWYNITLKTPVDTLVVTDSWKVMTNDFSLLQFPDTKNSGQYLLAGARLENIKGTFISGVNNFYNVILHGEYRNKTRNKLWDILARGEFYLNGFNSGDYSAYASLARFLNKKLGYISLVFNNVNRSQSFIYNPASSFSFGNTSTYNKENITMISATADNPFINLSATDYFITNYNYFSDYYKTAQYNRLINLLRLSASKKIRISKKWNWYTEVTMQQTDAAAPVKVPLVYTRNRIAFEGVFYKRLNLSTGIEFRYYTPYKEYNYSPVMGQFMPQDSVISSNRPDISAFLHFRIRSFTGYLRAENLNTVSFSDGFAFDRNNFAAPHYPYQGFIFRFGIQWNFVN